MWVSEAAFRSEGLLQRASPHAARSSSPALDGNSLLVYFCLEAWHRWEHSFSISRNISAAVKTVVRHQCSPWTRCQHEMLHRGIAALIPARQAAQRKVQDHAHSLLCRAATRPANRGEQRFIGFVLQRTKIRRTTCDPAVVLGRQLRDSQPGCGRDNCKPVYRCSVCKRRVVDTASTSVNRVVEKV